MSKSQFQINDYTSKIQNIFKHYDLGFYLAFVIWILDLNI